MERIPKHSVGLLTILLFIIDITTIQCATVTGDDKTGLLGNNPVTLTCQFNVNTAANEVATSVTLQRQRQTESSFSDVASFTIATNSSLYKDPSIPNRTVLMLMEDSANLKFNSLECNDAATYKCLFEFAVGQVGYDTEDNFVLTIEAKPPNTLTIPPAYNPNSRTLIEGEELELRCEGDVGLPAGTFKWFGYKTGTPAVDLTPLAVDGAANSIGSGLRYCAFRRESTLKMNLTRDNDGLVIRCAVSQSTLGDPPTAESSCDDWPCKQTGAIVVEYPIRQQDIAVSSNPYQNQYIVGSQVTLKCTVDGNPNPYFRWEKENDENVSLEGQETWTLSNLQLGDSGIYLCYANNTINGIMYNASKSININVVETTTSSSTSTSAPTSTETQGGKTEPVTEPKDEDNTTTIIIAVCVVLGVLLIVAAIVAFIIIKKRKAKESVEEPPEKPYNKNNLHMYNPKPDLVGGDEKKHNHNFKNDDGLTYADLKFDDKPRSRRPVALADSMTDYADITIPQV